MKIMRYALAFAALYLLFLIVTFPAQHAYSMVKERLPAQLYQLGGSIWRGTAETIVFGDARLHKVSWKAHPLALLIGDASVAITAKTNNGNISATVNVGLDKTITIEELHITMPASDLQTLSSAIPLDLHGHINADLETLTLDNGYLVAAQGTIRWDSAAVTAIRKTKLDDLSLLLSTEDEQVIGKLTSKGQRLRAKADITLENNGNYTLNGIFSATNRNNRQLEQSLRILGHRGKDGRYHVNKSGTLPPLYTVNDGD
ncbi:MAG: type II secretion system protein N [Gammaproteobacteria bacterium]|nr:type II secretion system protein N [Gammaproteobacteria bacterium]